MSKFLTSIKGYKTLAFNIASIVAIGIAGFTGQVTDPETLKVLMFVQAAANVALRFLTSTPVGGDKGGS